MLSQKDAVVNAILACLTAKGIEYELSGDKIVKSLLTKEDKVGIRKVILEGFLADEIGMTDDARKKHAEESEMKKYVNGLVNNWINKYPPFNRDEKWVAKNPGSRKGQGDEPIKSLQALQKTTTDVQALADIDKAILDRLAEIKPTQVLKINVDVLPEHLRHLVPTEDS